MLSFFWLMHFPLNGSPKCKGLFDCLFSENKKWPFAAFLRNSSQNRKNVHQLIHFVINFVLISSGKTKFSMASCLTICCTTKMWFLRPSKFSKTDTWSTILKPLCTCQSNVICCGIFETFKLKVLWGFGVVHFFSILGPRIALITVRGTTASPPETRGATSSRNLRE